MELTGHSGEVFSAKFDPTGRFIASGSMDRSICMDCPSNGKRTPSEAIADDRGQCYGTHPPHVKTTAN